MSRLSAPQDDCWDSVCSEFSRSPDQKFKCLNEKAEDICKCCKNRNIGDCSIIVPAYGDFNPCKKTFSDGKTLEEITKENPVPQQQVETCITLADRLVKKLCDSSIAEPLNDSCFLRKSNMVYSCCQSIGKEDKLNIKKSKQCGASYNQHCATKICGNIGPALCGQDLTKRNQLRDCCKQAESSCIFGNINMFDKTEEEKKAEEEKAEEKKAEEEKAEEKKAEEEKAEEKKAEEEKTSGGGQSVETFCYSQFRDRDRLRVRRNRYFAKLLIVIILAMVVIMLIIRINRYKLLTIN